MRDLTLWYQACMQKTGRPGVMEWDWLLNSLKGRLVRLGRLQYEPGNLEEAIRTNEYSFSKGGVNWKYISRRTESWNRNRSPLPSLRRRPFSQGINTD